MGARKAISLLSIFYRDIADRGGTSKRRVAEREGFEPSVPL
jgi:hypothetical protein